MYHLTILWLCLCVAAFVAGILRGRASARFVRIQIAYIEELASELEAQPREWPPIPREHLASVIRDRLRGAS